MIPYRGSVQDVIKELEAGIRSGFSYTGALNITELQTKAEFVKQTSSGLAESHPHIKVKY